MPINNVRLSCIVFCSRRAEGCTLSHFRDCVKERADARRTSFFTSSDYDRAQRRELQQDIDSTSVINV